MTIHLPVWGFAALSTLATLWAIATVLANATTKITDAQIAEIGKRSPRFGSILKWARHWGMDVWPGIVAVADTFKGVFRFVPVIMILYVSCGGSQHPRTWYDEAHIGINTAAHALVAEDAALSSLMQSDADAGVSDAQQVARYGTAARDERATLDALSALESGVNTAQQTGAVADRCRISFLVEHVQTTLSDMESALAEIGRPVPADVASLLPTLASIATAASPSCTSSSPPPSSGSVSP
jgi:hypothetical protein